MGGPGYPQPGGPGWYGRFDPADPLISDDYAGWWRRSTAVIKAGWKQLAILQLIAVAPMLVLLGPAQIFADLQQRAADRNAAQDALGSAGVILVGVVVLLGAGIVAGLIYAVGQLATARTVVAVATGGRIGVGEALRSVLHRLPALVGWYLLAGLICVGALLACVLPVFYVAAVFTILPAVVLFERGNAISRCFALFHTDLGAAVGRVATIIGVSIAGAIVFGALSTPITLATTGASAFTASADPSVAAVVLGGLLTSVLDGVYYVLSGVVLTPLIVATYADLRARHEPFSTAYLMSPQVD
jgi:hypothetical protein